MCETDIFYVKKQAILQETIPTDFQESEKTGVHWECIRESSSDENDESVVMLKRHLI